MSDIKFIFDVWILDGSYISNLSCFKTYAGKAYVVFIFPGGSIMRDVEILSSNVLFLVEINSFGGVNVGFIFFNYILAIVFFFFSILKRVSNTLFIISSLVK